MKWVSHAAPHADLDVAAAQAAEAVDKELADVSPDLVLAFASPAFTDRSAQTVREAFPDATVLGCGAGGIIGGDREIEGQPSISLTAAHLPGTRIHVQAFGAELGPSLESRHLRAALAPDGGEPAVIIALLDPHRGDPKPILAQLDEAFPSAVVIGGLASPAASGLTLLVDGRPSSAGGVFVAVHGGLSVRPVVAQGCRPIGEAMLVTKVEGNLVYELGQERPVEVMRRLHERLGPEDRELFQRSLFLGVEMRDQREYQHGDFLIRNILGIEPKSGALAVGALLEPWVAVQFHLRERQASAADLQRRLRTAKAEINGEPRAALLFSCLGRGEGLYGVPHHDTQVIQQVFDGIPVGGFFCNGEIGPVSGKTYLHGYTSAVLLVSELAPTSTAYSNEGEPPKP